jgi:hypothetical protein
MWTTDLFGGGEDAEADKVSALLVNVGLWERSTGGYQIHDYDHYQRSAEEIEAAKLAYRTQRSLAGKSRVAGAKRDAKGRLLSQVKTSEPSGPTSGAQKSAGKISQRLTPSDSSLTDADTINTTTAHEFESDFNECWERYPRKDSRKRAMEKYQARRREGISHADLLMATEGYAQMRKGKDPDYTMMGSTFYGPSERWKDYLTVDDPWAVKIDLDAGAWESGF